jgi:hypothetical protein
MKMVKSLLLGSAAGLVAVSAGQAADLPVKAKPVEYVKVCSLYGAGFYYMPGTDICLKIGGYVRAETTWHSNGNFTQGPVQGNFNDRATSEMTVRARAYITADAREQTAWGTARAYVAVGVATADTGNTQIPSILGFNRAFIQWAGLTAGVTQSFFDFYSSAAANYRGYLPSSDTGDSGWWVFAYTAQLGNGLSASISAEARRLTQMINLTGGANTGGTTASGMTNLATSLCGVNAQPGSLTSDLAASVAANTGPLCQGGMNVPDIVGNIRIDQTWGSAQIMAVAHEDNAGYYGQTVSNTLNQGATGPGFGHPGDKWGFVVGAGLRLNFPMIAQGDYFQSQVNYTQGALRYLDHGGGAPTLFFERGNGGSYGLMSDCVYGAFTPIAPGTAVATSTPVINQSGCQLTTGWSFNASYEHYWTPQLHESFYGGYMAVRYNSQANNMLCNYESFGIHAGPAGFGSAAQPVGGCNNNWSIWSVGTRVQYDFTKTLYLGVDFLYQGFQTAKGLNDGNNTFGSILAGQFNTATTPSGINLNSALKDTQNLAVTARIHKDFLP